MVGGSGGTMVQGMMGHGDEFGFIVSDIEDMIQMISHPSSCCVARVLQGAAETPVKKPPK